jgi:CheY-like chemotaxis protein
MGGRPRVLVVEDDDASRMVQEDVLGEAGYDVTAVNGGAGALASLGLPPPPDVIVLDLVMPGIDGWAFAREYRRRPGPHAPIVVVTALEGADRRPDFRELRAAGFVFKPLEIDGLLAALRRAIGG